ncbi:hypothetical protein NEOLEDRAFT_404612 [Neolentinus lepideus HHB14362 ss-1]|uniref:Mixed lineage kinase domain-containing protein n=1 Tax=Neolentinus lepideus HHB14362 ss-1 TaxID=1314782 RepID=A0A165S3H1_9AGAM|nr:hypothetical protein NEOLEDRAFT_404612 [Neolentinus lepideus HHB14362 ss-1]
MPSMARRFWKRKKKNRPCDEDNHGRSVALESAGVILDLGSKLVDGSLLNMPVLAPILDVAQKIIKICQAMQSNKDDAASLANAICTRLQLLEDCLKAEAPSNLNEAIQADVSRLTNTLSQIHTRMMKLSTRGRAGRFLKHKSDRGAIDKCQRLLGEAMDNFKMLSLCQIRIRVTQEHAGDERLTPSSCNKESEATQLLCAEDESSSTCAEEHRTPSSRSSEQTIPPNQATLPGQTFLDHPKSV